MKTQPAVKEKIPTYFANYISFVGAAITMASLVSVVLLVLLEMTSSTPQNPYLGIFTYIIFPSILMFGLAVLSWCNSRAAPSSRSLEWSVAPYPRLDLNDPLHAAFFTFLWLHSFLFQPARSAVIALMNIPSRLSLWCFLPYADEAGVRGFQASPHARVRCVDCHVGGGGGSSLKTGRGLPSLFRFLQQSFRDQYHARSTICDQHQRLVTVFIGPRNSLARSSDFQSLGYDEKNPTGRC